MKNLSFFKQSTMLCSNHKGTNQKGNVFALIFAAVGLVGVLGVVGMQTISGPVRTITQVTQKNITDTDLLTNARIVILNASTLPSAGDADADGYIEPIEYIPTSDPNCDSAPTGGGCLPSTIGAILTDPWGTDYGYCVWDHGSVDGGRDDSGTGTDNRLQGEDSTSQPVLAIISAGPNRTFDTTCGAFDASGVEGLSDPEGAGDDTVRFFSYSAALAGSGGLWSEVGNDAQIADPNVTDEIILGGGARIDIGGVNTGTAGTGSFPAARTDFISSFTGGTTPVEMTTGLRLESDDDYSTCAGGTAGTIIYNNESGSERIQFCDGTSYVDVGGSADAWRIIDSSHGSNTYVTVAGTADTNTDTVTFHTAGSDRMVIDNTGNVGIGGASGPAGALDVSGGDSGQSVIIARSSENGSHVFQAFTTLNGNPNTEIFSMDAVDSSTDRVEVFYGTERVNHTARRHRFQYTGDMTFPNSSAFRFQESGTQFELVSSTARQSMVSMGGRVLHSGTAAVDALLVDPRLTSLGDGTSGSGNNLLRLANTGVDQFVVDVNGNVGIGHSAPNHALDIEGSTTDHIIHMQNAQSDGDFIEMYNSNNNQIFSIGTGGAGGIQPSISLMNDAGNRDFRISQEGTVFRLDSTFGTTDTPMVLKADSGIDQLYLDTDGTVTVGRSLEVAETVKIGAGTCTSAADEGKIQYTTLANIQYCNGAAWQAVSGTVAQLRNIGNVDIVADPTDGHILQWNDTDKDWEAVASSSVVSSGGGSVAGSDTHVQFNDSGDFGGSASFTWDGSTLTVDGDINYTGVLTDTSDRRLKSDIKPLDPETMIEKLMEVDTYAFTMKNDTDNKIEMGVMAQELEKLFPDLVKTADDSMGTKSVNYTGLVAPMISSIQNLKNRNDALEAEIKVLQNNQNQILKDVQNLNIQVGISRPEEASFYHILMVMIAILGFFGFVAAFKYSYKK